MDEQDEYEDDAEYEMPTFSALAKALSESANDSYTSWMKDYASNLMFEVSRMVETKIIRDEKEISFNVERKYFQEKSLGAEIFFNREDFVVTLSYSQYTFKDYVKQIDLSKKPGIYIIFDQDSFYVGQSARSILKRFESHDSDDKKKSLQIDGEVLFFGRVDNRLGKDKLDYLERVLIKTLSTGHRSKINRDNGNISYISEESKAFCDYLLESIHRIAAVSKINPFKEEQILRTTFWGRDFDFGQMIRGIPKINTYTEDAVENLEQLIALRMKRILLVEQTWPVIDDGVVKTRPIEKSDRKDSFFCKSRDGDWPNQMEASEDEIEKFEGKLFEQYWRNNIPNVVQT